ncbi:MAG: DUF1326 domain-containing protein [Ectothiorhodospira sp.]
MTQSTESAYQLDGTLLEICSCAVPCPCFIGEDPDGGECLGVIAFHLDQGKIGDQDVSGRTVVNVAHIPGNALAGDWRSVLIIDDGATDEQHNALVSAFSGQLGGGLADLAGLVGELVAVERAPVIHEVDQANGSFRIPGIVEAQITPIQPSPDGATATLRDSAFSTIKDAPAYIGKSSGYRVNLPDHDMSWSFEGRNSIQTAWHMEHQP